MSDSEHRITYSFRNLRIVNCRLKPPWPMTPMPPKSAWDEAISPSAWRPAVKSDEDEGETFREGAWSWRRVLE